MEGTLVVKIENNGSSALDMEVFLKINQPLELTCSSGQSRVLSFRRGSSNHMLFLGFSRNKRVAKKKIVSTNGAWSIHITSSIYIAKAK